MEWCLWRRGRGSGVEDEEGKGKTGGRTEDGGRRFPLIVMYLNGG